jgi:hypothetical protein
MNDTQSLLTYARQHGFEASAVFGGESIIYSLHMQDGPDGVDVYYVTTWNRLREVLGY